MSTNSRHFFVHALMFALAATTAAQKDDPDLAWTIDQLVTTYRGLIAEAPAKPGAIPHLRRATDFLQPADYATARPSDVVALLDASAALPATDSATLVTIAANMLATITTTNASAAPPDIVGTARLLAAYAAQIPNQNSTLSPGFCRALAGWWGHMQACTGKIMKDGLVWSASARPMSLLTVLSSGHELMLSV